MRHMKLSGQQGAVAFDGTTVTLTWRSGEVVDFPAECVCAAWVDHAGSGQRSLEFTVAGGDTVSTYRMAFGWRCADQLEALRDRVMTARIFGSRPVSHRVVDLSSREYEHLGWKHTGTDELL